MTSVWMLIYRSPYYHPHTTYRKTSSGSQLN